MRSLTITFIWILSLNMIYAQVPLGFSFQTIIRDSEGKVQKNQSTGLQFSILEGSATGVVVYSETHTVSTNDFGVINLTVGTGIVKEGVFADIVWGSNIHFLKTQIDPTGGSTYTISTTSQLMSVPYAMYAMKADTALKVPDSSVTNEIQVLSISNDTIYLSDGGYAKLPAGFDGDYTNLTNKPTIPTNTSDLTNDSGFLTSEVDGSITNEIQVLSISNDTIYLSDGGYVKLPGDTISSGVIKGEMLYWDGFKWSRIEPGVSGQQFSIDENGIPKWMGDSYPIVSTVSVTSVTANSATINADVSSSGGQSVTSRGIVYDTADNPTLLSNSKEGGSGTGIFSVSINGLTPNTIYYVRGYGINSVGTGYGNSLNFSTSDATIPILTTKSIFAITQTSAISGGEISSDGGSTITEKGVVWSTSPNPTILDNKTSDGSGTGNFSSTITGLSDNTTYYVRSYATNLIGTAYGTEKSFNTLPLPNTILWDNLYGGSGDEGEISLISSLDGGFILAGGTSSSYSGTVNVQNKGNTDFFISKISGLGEVQWSQLYGGNSFEYAHSVIALDDGGFILSGPCRSSQSYDVTPINNGNDDWWIFRIDASRNIVWQKLLGSIDYDIATNMVMLSDGNILQCGFYGSYQDRKFLLKKFDLNGNILWEKEYKGSSQTDDWGVNIMELEDGNLIFSGFSNGSQIGDITDINHGDYEFWILKLDSNGNIVWDNLYGGSGTEKAYKAIQISDGNIIIIGTTTSSLSWDINQSGLGGEDLWVLKINQNGDILERKIFGGENHDKATTIIETNDGNILIGGVTASNTGFTEPNIGNNDLFVLKLNYNLEKIWDKRFGSTGDENILGDIIEVSDGYVIGARTNGSQNNDVSGSAYGLNDYWIFKISK